MNQERTDFGGRLREERDRLGLSQQRFGELCGVRRVAQYLYEIGERAPTVDYLQKAREVGVDVAFLLMGKRNQRITSNAPTGLTLEQISLLYKGVDAIAVDRRGRPLGVDARVKIMEAACRVMMSDEKLPEAMLQGRLLKFATAFK